MATININAKCDLNKPVVVRHLDGMVFSQDVKANMIRVSVFRDREPVDLSGGSVSANIIRADGATVVQTGTIEGNVCSVVLPSSAYAVPGQIAIFVKHSTSAGPTTSTIAAITGYVYKSTTDTIVDPGSVVPNVNQLLAMIEDCEEATEACIAATAAAPVVDDTAGAGDTNKVWSADKSHLLLTEINSKADELKNEIAFTNSYIMDEIQTTIETNPNNAPDVLLGTFKVTSGSGAKLYNGTQNASQLLNIKEGTFSIRDVTIQVSGNTVTINGKPSSTFNYSLVDGESKTSTELAQMTLPLPVHAFTLSQKVTSGTVYPSMLVRSKSSGSSVVTQNNTAQFVMDTSVHGGLYLYMDSSKTYSCTFKIALFPYNTSNGNTHREEASSVTVIEDSGVYYLDGTTWYVGNVTLAEIHSKLPKTPKIKYSTRAIEYSSMVECLDVYIPTNDGYIDYVFGHTQGPGTRAQGYGNVWRLVETDAVSDAFAKKFKITQLGETEMALQLVGRDDFIGGTTHGDEWMDENSLLFILDGKNVDITDYTNYTEFNTLQVFLVSTMYDPNDHETVVGTHGREWLFNSDGLYIGQTVDFSEQVTLQGSYMPMLCALRGNDTASALQVTDTYVDDGSYQQYDVSEGGFTTYPNKLKGDVREINLFGEDSKVSIKLKILEQPDQLKGQGVFLYNGVNTYNKIYCTLCGYGNVSATQETIEEGTKWKVKSQITIDVG